MSQHRQRPSILLSKRQLIQRSRRLRPTHPPTNARLSPRSLAQSLSRFSDLKQPKETSDLSAKSDKEPQETIGNEPLEDPKLSETEAEDAWSSGASGADEGWGTPDESRTPDPSEGADWGSEAAGVGWGEPVEQTDGWGAERRRLGPTHRRAAAGERMTQAAGTRRR